MSATILHVSKYVKRLQFFKQKKQRSGSTAECWKKNTKLKKPEKAQERMEMHQTIPSSSHLRAVLCFRGLLLSPRLCHLSIEPGIPLVAPGQVRKSQSSGEKHQC
ncbi:uncharacterized protein ACIQIH_005634 [Cyanocitta cristata]